ncbi:hypothetical protein KM043_017897 [Ampulex compressa]|nr:hypothetical protein KM043_017897 [Ampulex compressa]
MTLKMEESVKVESVPYTTPDPGEEVVISGIAGKFPESDNMRILQKNLFDKVDLVTDDDRRWTADLKEIPHRMGKVNNISKFDTVFFGIHPEQAQAMDPVARILMEQAYEAVIDAGVNPKELRGTKTAVIAGCSFIETEQMVVYEKPQPRGLGLIGCSRSLLSNRIAYWLGVHGPSYTVDTACSTALVAIEQAYTLMRIGKCDAAIVATGNLCLYPQISLQFARLVHGLSNCDGFKEQGMTFPSSKLQSTLFKDCYDQCGLSPSVLSFLEAHATGTKVGDPEEIDAIGNVFCEGRTTPLKIGSVKSNLGHTEASCGLCSVAKIIIAMETGFIPPNLYYKKPRETMKALIEGKLEVVTDVTPWNGGYAGINSFAVGGVNCHVVLKSNSKEKINGGAPTDELPRLVVASGRTKEAVLTILQDVESRSIDVEYIRLLHDIHSDEIQGHVYRGYTVVGSKLDEAPSGVEEYSGSKRPICFVFSGMGSQWPSMGEALLKFPVFARAIGKCDTTLKTHGLDIYNILKNTNTKIFDDILSSFVGIVAVQIGLVDLLTCVGIVPDNMIGHSVGELACAYADGCFTAEQTITAAYYRGLACKESQLEQGSMAAVGRGYNEIKDICPSDIVVACHNSTRSCTISGPTNSIKAFVAHLQENDIFAKEVPTSNIAFHSPYIKPASPKLLNYLKQVIPHPNPRSTKWISTSVPHSAWSSPIAKYSSAEYHTNNLLNPVLFEEGIALIPEDAIVIEVAPHGLLQAILRRSMPSTTLNVPLTRRDHKDNAEMVLGALGKLYSAGLQPQLANLYPPVEYPVSRGTPMISPLIRWDYSEEWSTHLYNKHQNLGSGEREVTITLRSENFENLTGHVLDGRNIMPGSEYLTLVWETFAIMNGNEYLEMSVVFENVKFHRTIILRENYDVKLFVVIQQGTGKFEITEKGIPVVTGQIRRLDESSQERVINEVLESSNQPDKNSTDDKWMETKDIYKELNLRGFHGFSNIVQSEKCMTWPVPKEWTLEDAATVPHAYATSYYALCLAGKMKKGDKILIHAGSGSVGQAAIHLALHEGCEIFTTVGSLEERKFIRETFSSIDEDHIGNSQNTSFEQMILKETNGRGVDIILNSLTEDKLQASLRCLAPKGRFLEIGNVELASNNYLGMDIFFKEISFQRVVLKNLFIADTNEKMQLQQLFLNGLHSGAIKPLSRRVFGKDEVESALRYMAAGKYIGKVVLQIHKDKAEVDAPILAQPRFYCQPNRCYVIVGGLGGFGVEFVDWLVLRGAKHLVLVSRNGVQNGYQRARTELWKSYGTEVSIITGLDLSSKKDCEFLLKSAEKMAPVGGIFNVAVVLQDRIFTNQTPDTFAETFIPKAWATDRLDTVSRKLCPKLEHFVVFSSVSSSRGNAGQTNYCMSNSVMERICERRVQEGLPGLAIQWSSIGQVGLLTKIAKDDKVIVIGGQLPQNISSCLLQLDKFLLQSLPIVASTVLAEKNTDGVDLSSIANTVAHIIGLKDLKTVSQQKVLAELGVDSVMTVEVQQALEKNFGVLLSAKDIRNLTFAKLLDMNKVTSYNTGGDQQQSAVAGSSTDRAKNL